jgi:hypothetical protein
MMKTKRFNIPIYLRFIFAFLLLFAVKTGFSAETVACETSWFNSGDALQAKELVNDFVDDGVFSDNNVCYMERRKEFAYILVTALEERLKTSYRKNLELGSPSFNDISELSYKFKSAIKKAYGDGNTSPTNKFGILSNESQFRPDEHISRIEALVMSVRAYEDFCGEITGSDKGFSDYYNAESWMRPYLAKGKSQELVHGYLNGSDYTNYFAPNKQVPRHETVAFVQKLIDQIEKCGGTTTDNGNDTVSRPNAPNLETTSSSIKASWSSVSGASKYYLERAINGQGYEKIYCGSHVSYIDTSAKVNQRYYYRVSAGNSNADCGNYQEASNGWSYSSITNNIKREESIDENVTITLTATGTGEGGFVTRYGSQKLCDASDIRDNDCQVTIAKGTEVSITAAYEEPNTFAGWDYNSCSGSSSSNPIVFDAKECTVTAIFNEISTATYNLKVIPTDNGTVKLPENDPDTKTDVQSCSLSSSGDCTASDIPENTNVVLSAIPDTTDDYIFLGWKNKNNTACLSSSELQNPNPDFNITSNCEVSAEFGKDAVKEALKTEIVGLNEEVKKLNDDLDDANQKIDDLSKKVEEQEGDIEKLQNELEQVKEESSKKDEEIEKLKDQVDELIEKSVEVDDLKEDVAELEKALEKSEKKHEEVVKKLEEELEEVKKKVEELEAEKAQRDFLKNLIPINPTKGQLGIDYTSDLELSWKAGEDPNGLFNQSTTFSVYLKTLQEDEITLTGCDNLAAQNLSCVVSAELLVRGQTYIWGIDKMNGSEVPLTDTGWNFTTQSNTAPSKPTYISPENGKADVNPEEDLNLSWNPSSDNDGDTLKYDCWYRKAGTNLEKSCTLDSTGSHLRGFIEKDDLENEAPYEWWVKVSDGKSEVIGDTWNFSTTSAPIGLTLEAISGYNSMLLKWSFTKESFNNNDDIKYHILRTEKPDNTGSKDVVLNLTDHDISGVDGVNGANASCLDEGNATDEEQDTCNSSNTEVLERGKDYCYSVYAVVEGVEYKSEPACATFGMVTLAIESQRANIADGFVTIPVSILNAGNLQIGNADVDFQYDTDYLLYSNGEDVVGEIIDGDIAGLSAEDITVTENEEQQGIIRFSFASDDALVGEGALFRVKLKLTENALQLEDEVDVNFSLLNDNVNSYVTAIYDDSFNPVLLELKNGDAVRLTKDRREGASAKITLTKAYFRGDLNGDTRRITVDAAIARHIGVGKIQDFTTDQYNAGKINVDQLVNSNDGRMIIYHRLHDVWPDEIERQTRSRRNVRSDKAQDAVVLHLSDIQANSGEEVETTLSVNNLLDLAATNLVLVYDTSVIDKVLKVTKTGIASRASLVYHDNDTGLLRIGLDSQDPITGSGDIATIKLRLKTSDSITSKTSGLRIAHTLLYDVSGRNMSTSALQTRIEADNATITLNDIVEPEQPERQPAITPLPDNDPSQQAIYSIIGKVVDSRGNAIHGVTISAGDKTTVTDDFFWILQDYTEGSYTVTATKEGYSFEPQTCTLSKNQNCSVTFSTKPAETSDTSDDDNGSETEEPTETHPMFGDFQATITVLDKAGQGLPNISIEVSGESIATETYVTDANGQVNIPGLFQGEYTASLLTALDYVYESKTFKVTTNTKHAKVYLKPSAPKFTVKTQWTPTKVYEGDTSGMLYQPVIINNGEQIATNIQLSFNLAPNATAISAKVDAPEGLDAGTCNIAGQVITCDIMDLLPNEGITVSIIAMPTGTDTMVNVAQVSSEEYPPHTETLKVGIIPYFSVNSWAIPNRVLKDNYAVLRIRLSNNPFNTTEVNSILTKLPIPFGVEFESYQTDAGNCQYAEHTLTCNVNPIPVGEYVDIDVTVKSSVVGKHAYQVLTTSNFPDQETNRWLSVTSPLPAMPRNADIFIAFDTTGSMEDNLEAAKGAVKQFVELAKDKAVKPIVGLVFFKDDAQVVLVTDDLQLIIDKLDSVVPSGGDEQYFCREASEQAIIKALDSLKVKDGVILLVTDAPPHPNTDLDTALSIMQSEERKVTFNALVAGDECNAAKFNTELQERLNTRRLRVDRECDTTTAEQTADMRELYQCMADETGGTLFDHDVVNNGNESDIAAKQADILAVLTGVLEKLNPSATTPPDDDDPAKNGNREKLVAVDENGHFVPPPVANAFWVYVGSPNGHVISQPAGIDCNKGYGQCFYYFKRGTKLKLIPIAPEGLYLHSWYGDVECEHGEFTVTGMKGCNALFYGIPGYQK